MVIPVYNKYIDGAQGRGLTDTVDFDGFVPWHQKFYHPATTQYWTKRGYYPLLTIARCLFLASIVVGLLTFGWFLWGTL